MIDQSAFISMLLLFSMLFLSVTIMFCLWRGILGPRFTDRIVAVNIIGTKTILLICVLALYLNEGYLIDVSLIYALLSFLAVAILSKVYLISYKKRIVESQKAGEQGEKQWSE